ncbi:MAG TPA: hypothetical protein VNC22_23205 [Sporichthya sp.]|jgi:hypothetical protein|nr:hypothetical protein [Sporichthya sp.]
MASPCTQDSNSVALTETTDGKLEADVRLQPLTTGSLGEDTNGIGVTFAPDGGIHGTATGAALKLVQGLYIGTEGLVKVNGYAVSSSPGSSPNANLVRGSNVQYGNTLTLNGSLASNQIASYVMTHARWRGFWATNLTAFGGLTLDRVDAYLQLNVDGGGWNTVDIASLTRADQGGTFELDYWYPFVMANGTAHTIQSRLLVGGGTVTASNPQGIIESEFGGVLEWLY